MVNDLSPSVEALAESALDDVNADRSVYVEGPVGSGRNSLVEKLVTLAVDRAATVHFLPITEADASGVALLEATSHLGGTGWPTLQTGSDAELHAAAREVGQHLRELKKFLVIRVPDSWQGADDPPRAADVLPLRARSVLHGFFESGVATVVVADAAITPSSIGFYPAKRLQMRPHSVGFEAMASLQWGRYSLALDELRRSLPSGLRQSPLAWRLAVGAIALGAPRVEVVTALKRPVAFSGLIAVLTPALLKRPDVQAAVNRFLAVRRPMARSAVADLCRVPAEHAPLLTDCIAYGGESVRVAAVVRTHLLARMSNLGRPDAADHQKLAEHYAKEDGAASPKGLIPAALCAWTEKAHHLAASASQDGGAAWEKLELPAPSFYWDHARHASIEDRDYRRAAKIYERCTRHFPADDYSWHYLAFNLQRAGGDAGAVRRAYERAIELNPDNAWWNSRLVTFLIRSGSPGAAKQEWRRAIERVDPDGTQVMQPWLPQNFHLWVCRAWLSVGQLAAAREVLDLMPPNLKRKGAFARLQRRTEKAPMGWQRFMANLEARYGVPATLAGHARRWWATLAAGRDLPLPMAEMTRDEERFQFAWNYERLLLEIEAAPDGTLSWFALDKDSRQSGGGEVAGAARLPADLTDWLSRLKDA
jgi:tetratricopeptide (TPR) repeat protein